MLTFLYRRLHIGRQVTGINLRPREHEVRPSSCQNILRMLRLLPFMTSSSSRRYVCSSRRKSWPSKPHGRSLFLIVLLCLFQTSNFICYRPVDVFSSIFPVLTRRSNIYFLIVYSINRACLVIILIIIFLELAVLLLKKTLIRYVKGNV